MKTTSFYRAGLCIALASCIFTFTMCKKSSNNNAASYSQRITGYDYYEHDTLFMKFKLTYAGNLVTDIISSFISSDTGVMEMQKTTIQYSGNAISSITDFSKNSGSWKKSSVNEIVGYSGDNPLEIIYHSYNDAGTETYQSKTKYIYDGNILIKTEDYHFYTGSWELSRSTFYKYDDKGRIIQECDTVDSYGTITTFSYNAEHRTESLTLQFYLGNMVNDNKTIYEYTNNRLLKTSTYNWTADSWHKTMETSYEYNESGNLIRERYDDTDYNYNMRLDVTYGDGAGNFTQFLKIKGGNEMFPGDPTPYPVKSSGPFSAFNLNHTEKVNR